MLKLAGEMRYNENTEKSQTDEAGVSLRDPWLPFKRVRMSRQCYKVSGTKVVPLPIWYLTLSLRRLE